MRHLTTAIGIRPESVSTRLVLTSALLAGDSRNEAEAEAREAVRLRPDDPMTHWTLGGALRWQGKQEESGRELREAVRLRPDDGRFHYGLATLLSSQLKFDDSLPEYREAIRLRPDDFGLYQGYAQALRRKTDYAGALAVIRQAQARSGVCPRRIPVPGRLARQDRVARGAGRAAPGPPEGEGAAPGRRRADRAGPDVLRQEALRRLAPVSWRGPRRRPEARREPRPATPLQYGVLRPAGGRRPGRGRAPPRTRRRGPALRRRALGWLRAELAAWSGVVESGTSLDREKTLSIIRWWTRDVDLVSVRGDDALAKLPEAERREWRKFWDDYDALMRKGGETKPR